MKPAETGGRVLWRIGCGVATTVLSIARASHLVYMGSSTGKHIIQLHFGDVLNVAVERSHFPVTYEWQKKKQPYWVISRVLGRERWRWEIVHNGIVSMKFYCIMQKNDCKLVQLLASL